MQTLEDGDDGDCGAGEYEIGEIGWDGHDTLLSKGCLWGFRALAPNTLSARLKSLEGHGVIATRLYESHPPRYEYFLTEKGKALGPVLKALHGWGERFGS